MRRFWTFVVTAVAVLGFTPASNASVILEVSEMGNDLVFSYTGSLDHTGMEEFGSGQTPVEGFFFSGGGCPPTGRCKGRFHLDWTSLLFGTGEELEHFELPVFPFEAAFPPVNCCFRAFVRGSATGTGFWLGRSTISLPSGYVPNDPLFGTLTLPNHSFDTLGLVAGVYQTDLPSGDFIRLTIDRSGTPIQGPVPAVPEPTLLMLIASGGGAALLSRRRPSRAR